VDTATAFQGELFINMQVVIPLIDLLTGLGLLYFIYCIDRNKTRRQRSETLENLNIQELLESEGSVEMVTEIRLSEVLKTSHISVSVSKTRANPDGQRPYRDISSEINKN
jgi:hypothetical protein